MMEALPYAEMTPERSDPDVLVLSKPGAVYLVYALKEGPIKLQLPGDRDYTVEAIDTWTMKAEPLENAKPGEFAATAPRADYLLRITVGK